MHVCIKLTPLPLPPLHITALESPTFATSKRSPTKIAVEAVDPASLLWLFSDFSNSESVWLYASAVERKIWQEKSYSLDLANWRTSDIRTWNWQVGDNILIADLVSEMNFGWLIKLLNRFFLTYSAARAPPWPGKSYK